MRGAWRLMSAMALLLAGAAILLSAYLFTRLADEGMERRDQMCRLFERDHLADVERLRRTYAYLERHRRRSELHREVVRGLPQLEQEARVDSAPPFCDEPGIGLPEPDPVIPERRDFLQHP